MRVDLKCRGDHTSCTDNKCTVNIMNLSLLGFCHLLEREEEQIHS